ncbi:hypothetical protein [Burkholderia multivorans]|uniref:hypothetical protein n=1 Tax=Burkholderia multivorans TaxID=87883 RepID=UPI000CFF77B1|nr:hypothetical protein [Burkholderia multivorans]MBN6728519.1 hypothetical protein [Burkholderia multivorans]PRF79685.1 hypothetical protein C6Q12_04085 [Burkholderia multivorans]
MNTPNQPTAESLITWKRAKRYTRGQRIVRSVFRGVRNLLAICGVFFVYLLVLGYFQYQDQAAQTEVQCAVSRCM